MPASERGFEDIVCEGYNEFKWDTGYPIVRSRPRFANPDSLTRHVLSTSEMYTHWQSDDRSRYGLYIDNLLLKEIAINRFEINSFFALTDKHCNSVRVRPGPGK